MVDENFINVSERRAWFLLSGTGGKFSIQSHQVSYGSTTIDFSGVAHDVYQEA